MSKTEPATRYDTPPLDPLDHIEWAFGVDARKLAERAINKALESVHSDLIKEMARGYRRSGESEIGPMEFERIINDRRIPIE